jgi:lipoprotein-releasing system ATP-binding protein
MIQLNSIKKTYGTVEVLKNISLEIKKGEIVSIVGRSGAGKTTLLQIMGSLLNPDFGTVEINNTNIFNLKQKQLAKFRNEHIGFVFQFHQLLPEFTALENVCIPAFINNQPRKQTEQKAKDLLAFLNVSHRTTHKPGELSGGEQQRVAVARALINNPSVIFADEPSGNLDSKNKTELHELFFKLRDAYNQTFVIVTHDQSLADMSDRIIKMDDGHIVL